MALHELPVVNAGAAPARPNGGRHDGSGRYGAAHTRARDAYQDVPILKPPTWNHEIAAYFYLGGISAGSFVLAALAETFGRERYQKLARTAHYVAFGAMAPCAPLLIADLGKRSRFHHMLRIFKPSSPMNLGAWTLTAHGTLTTATLLRALATEEKLPLAGRAIEMLPARALGAGGIPVALTLGGYTGVLLGTTSVPVWFKSPLLGALFMASAMSTGTAAVNLATALGGRVEPGDDAVFRRLGLAGSLAELGLLGGYLGSSGSAAKAYHGGVPGLLMAGAAAGLAGAAALDTAGFYVKSKERLLGTAAAAATLIGGGLLRWAVVRAGRTSAQDREGTLEAMKPSRTRPGWGPPMGTERT